MNDYEFCLFGVPTDPQLVTQEHLDFIEEEGHVFVLFGNVGETFDGYNFFRDNGFGICSYDNVHANLQNNGRKLVFSIHSFKPQWNPKRDRDGRMNINQTAADKIVRVVYLLRALLGQKKIVFCVYGNLAHANKGVYRILCNAKEYSRRIINTKSSADYEIEGFYTLTNLLSGRELPTKAYKGEVPFDRTGTFFSSNSTNIDLPTDLTTSRSLDDIMDERARSFAGKQNIILWSGGIDSTAVLAAFVKNNVDFTVTVSDSTREENPELYDYVTANFNCTTVDDSFDLTSFGSSAIIHHGACADSLLPSCRWNYLYVGPYADYSSTQIIAVKIFIDRFDSPEVLDVINNPIPLQDIRTQHGYWDIITKQLIDRHIVDTLDDPRVAELKQYVDEFVSRWPLPITYYYELEYAYKFAINFHYASNYMLQSVVQTTGQLSDFYNSHDFQQWALVNFEYNLENYTETPQHEKLPLKEYAYKYFNIPSVMTKTKFSSLFNRKVTSEQQNDNSGVLLQQP